MKRPCLFPRCLRLAGFLALAAQAPLVPAAPRLESVPPSVAPATAPSAAFVPATPDDLGTLPVPAASAWDVSGSDGRRSQGWLWASPDHLLVRVLISGRAHQNDFAGNQAWRGDGIYLSIDSLGDSPDSALAFVQPDDLLIHGARGTGGVVASVLEHGRAELRQRAVPEIVRSVVHPAADETRYDLALPWALLSSGPGASPLLRLAHTAAFQGGGDLAWGKIRANSPDPRELHPLRLPDPQPAPTAALYPIVTQVLHANGHARLRAVLASPAAATLSLTLGKQSAVELPIPAGEGLRRFDLIIPQSDIPTDAAPVSASLVSAEIAPAVRLDFTLETPDTRLAAVRARFSALRDTAPHPLLREHCESTLSLVTAAHERLAYETDQPERAEQFLSYTEQILRYAPAERYDWADHVARGLPLLLRFLSPGDTTLQFYTLQVPVTPAPTSDARRPLTVYLHGSGNPNWLSDVSFAFSNTAQDTLFDHDPVPTDPVPFVHTGYIAAPWARGNRGYQDIAREDVLAMLADVERRFPIDSDRRYLTGFSMGGAGTWQIAARTPDLWAGVSVAAIASSLGTARSREFYLENLAHTPLDIWVGELDNRFLPGARILAERRQTAAAPTRFTVVPRVPHTYPYGAFKENTEWLGRHVRTRPREFRFTADHPDHLSAHGVTLIIPRLDRHPTLTGSDDELPRFHLRIEGSAVRLDYSGAEAIELDPAVLGLPADAEIVINGQTISRPANAPDRPLRHPAMSRE